MHMNKYELPIMKTYKKENQNIFISTKSAYSYTVESKIEDATGN